MTTKSFYEYQQESLRQWRERQELRRQQWLRLWQVVLYGGLLVAFVWAGSLLGR